MLTRLKPLAIRLTANSTTGICIAVCTVTTIPSSRTTEMFIGTVIVHVLAVMICSFLLKCSIDSAVFQAHVGSWYISWLHSKTTRPSFKPVLNPSSLPHSILPAMS